MIEGQSQVLASTTQDHIDGVPFGSFERVAMHKVINFSQGCTPVARSENSTSVPFWVTEVMTSNTPVSLDDVDPKRSRREDVVCPLMVRNAISLACIEKWQLE